MNIYFKGNNQYQTVHVNTRTNDSEISVSEIRHRFGMASHMQLSIIYACDLAWETATGLCTQNTSILIAVCISFTV